MMIKKITNWVFGSFFRTMGRFFFFLFFGFLLATILSRSNIQWTDLLGIEMVDALTYTTEVYENGTTIYDVNNTSDFTCQSWDSCEFEMVSSDSNPIGQKTFYFNRRNDTNAQYQEFQLLISQPVQIAGVDSTLYPVCTQWQQNGNSYTCTSITSVTGGTALLQDSMLQDMNISFKVFLANGNWTYCDLSGSKVTCPTWGSQITALEVTWNFKTHWTSYVLFRLNTVAKNLYASSIQQVIEQQENNTQQIIQSQENATQQQIESQQVCQHIDKANIVTDKKFLNRFGQESDNANYGITDYINIISAKIKVVEYYTVSGLCYYNVNKELIGDCVLYVDIQLNQELTPPANAKYARFTIYKPTNKPQFEICQNGNQAINNFINDDSTSEANSTASNFFSSFTTQDNGGISSIITAPLNAISGLVSSTCQQIVLPIPYLDNSNIVLPCMSAIYTEHFGQFFTIYQTIIFGAIAYRMLVSIFMMIQGFKNPDDDKIEVVDL